MTRIALFIEGCDPQQDTLEAFFPVSKLNHAQMEMARLQMGLGIPAHFTNEGEAGVWMIPLDHRAGGINAGRVLDLQEMIQLWHIYCDMHMLPIKSADGLLADLVDKSTDPQDPGNINWITGYIEGWDICQETKTAAEREN